MYRRGRGDFKKKSPNITAVVVDIPRIFGPEEYARVIASEYETEVETQMDVGIERNMIGGGQRLSGLEREGKENERKQLQIGRRAMISRPKKKSRKHSTTTTTMMNAVEGGRGARTHLIAMAV